VTYLEGVYWDLDGTIANTELEAHLPAFNNAFNDFNLNWYWDKYIYLDLLKINGGKNRISYYSKLINKSLNNEEVKKIHERKQYHYINYVKNNNVISLKPGVYRLINELHKKKVRQFIVTSSSKRQAKLITNKLFLEFNPFEFIISSDDVQFHKPNPLPYLKAMKLSGIKFNKSIVFEDSNSGLRSSLAAKLPTIYVPSNIPAVIDNDMNLECFLDSLGNESCKANVIKGPELESNYVDCAYLEKYLMTI
tara:strand:+ start:553 stop:1302 length:750 start_codon:yes stop_codon:yes gene_type:complete